MSHLVVVAYPDEATAERARDRLVQLQRQKLLRLTDAAIAVRRADGKVRIAQVTGLSDVGAVSGAFWGWLIGIVFLAPALGLALGAATGALLGRAVDVGVDDRFIRECGEALPAGTSALFVLATHVEPDRVTAEMKEFGGRIIQTTLSPEQEKRLREAFAAD
jgi:uncharacterized membrane protein